MSNKSVKITSKWVLSIESKMVQMLEAAQGEPCQAYLEGRLESWVMGTREVLVK